MASLLKKNRLKPLAPTEDNLPFHYKYIETKYDGFRMALCYYDKDNILALGRHEQLNYWSKVAGVFRPILDLGKIPNQSIIDGEIYLPGGSSNDVANRLSMGGEGLKFKAFALANLVFAPYDRARHLLESMGFDLVESKAVSSTLTKNSLVDMQEEIKRNNLEGYVLKQGQLSGWMKVKSFKSLDLVITGIKEGTGKYKNLCGVFEVSYWDVKSKKLVEVGSCKILEDQHRIPLEDANKYLYEIIEVKYETLTVHNRLKFAQFVRFRDDKPIQECTINE